MNIKTTASTNTDSWLVINNWPKGVTPRQLESDSMSTYSGPARLILADGTRVPGTASLKTNQHGRPAGWGGTFRPDETTAAVREPGDGLQIELPYEEFGDVAVTGTRRLLATQILMSLAGRGPAPF